MKCTECQTENPNTRKFCRECGSKLVLLCQECGGENLPGDKFCGECGQSLATPAPPKSPDLSLDEKISKIQRYLPEGLTEKILSQRDRIEGEKKQVTVMFCDMEGFTPLSERLGPEEMYALMDQVYEILIHKVNDYGGTVNELTGDGIMALFGAPVALEDAPQRAVRSALAIHKEINRFSERMAEEKGIASIRMRAGIHSGPVVVGTVGNNLRVEFKAIGDTVNLAARVQNLAKPGTTCVTGETFKLTEGLFRFESLGERKVKGREEPVWVYQVIAPSSSRTRFDVNAERGLTTFVGRDREIELLLDGLERAKEGNGQAFSIIGEAGVGKSRLLYEFRKTVANENITFLEGKCLSYGRGATYHPITEILKGAFDIGEGDGDSEVRERVQNGIQELGVEGPTALPYILELLSIKDSGIEKIPMSPEGKKDRIIETLKQILVRSSELRPLVMAIEDLHWADKSTEDVLKYLLEGIPAAKALLIFTYRPEFVHTWGGKSYHNQLTLNRLSNRESLRMAANLLGADQVDSQIGELILARAEGVPFFIEEFIKSLKDLNIIRKEESKYRLAKSIGEVRIPSTIQDMIMARVDALPQNAKELLQTGSVIEREFMYELIKNVTGSDDEELFAGFSFLKDAELLYERGVFPQSTYIFKHALTREVVYDSILSQKKKALHEMIGKVIESKNKDNVDDFSGILSEHFMRSENYERAAEYSWLAARKANRSGFFNDGISYGSRRVSCIECLPQTEEVQIKRIDSRISLALYMTAINHHIDAKNMVDPIFKLTREKGLKERIMQCLVIMGSYYFFIMEDLPSALRDFEETIKVAEEGRSPAFGAHYWLGMTFAWTGDFQRGEEHFQKAIEIATRVGSVQYKSAAEATLATMCHFFSGKINEGFGTTSKVVRISEAGGDIYSRSIAQNSHGTSCFAKGRLKEAESHLLNGIELSQRIDWHSWTGWSHVMLGELYSEIGEFLKAKENFELGYQTWEKWGMCPSLQTIARLGVAKSEILYSGKNMDSAFLHECLQGVKLNAFQGWAFRYMGEILMDVGDQLQSEAQTWILRAIEKDERSKMLFHLGLDHALYGGYFKWQGRMGKAQEELGKAIDILRGCGADGWVKKYERELATIQ